MNMLGSVLTMAGVGVGVDSSVGNEVPSSFGLVSQKNVGTILPSEPSEHLIV